MHDAPRAVRRGGMPVDIVYAADGQVPQRLEFAATPAKR
jgi:hypothetical protein